MALNIEIGRLWCDAQRLDLFLRLQIGLLIVRKFVLQLMYFSINLPPQMVYRGLWVEDTKASRICYAIEVRQRETVVIACPIGPYRPDEQWEYGLGVLAHIVVEIKDTVVVQRDSHTRVVQRRSIALQVLDGIGISMKHVGAFYYLMRLSRSTL